MKEYLLLGHNGYLGSYLHRALNCDILSEKNVYSNGNSYKYVINCIGKPDLEYCESNSESTSYANAYLIEDIKKYYSQSKIINFSSYYVYDDQGLCTEDSKTTDEYVYCKQKLISESLNKNGINLRIGKLFGNHFKKQNKLTEYILENDNLIIDEILFNPTSVKSISLLLKNKNFIDKNYGIFNFSNTGVTSHYDYALYIASYLKLDKKISKTSKLSRIFKNYGSFAMDISKINSKVNLNHWEDDIKDYLNLIEK
jgi:dTDP-4-dehydrorhamnose reductase